MLSFEKIQLGCCVVGTGHWPVDQLRVKRELLHVVLLLPVVKTQCMRHKKDYAKWTCLVQGETYGYTNFRMPYIKKDQRPEIDALIAPLIGHIQTLPLEEQDGALNYMVTKIIKSVYPKKYFHLNRALGVLSAITHELYRRVIGPYEDEKIRENGDV
jgi:hypothetical protein